VYRSVLLLLGIVVYAAPIASHAQTFPCPAGTEDMLNYFIMNYPDRADYYMGPGNANPIYSSIFPDNGVSFAATGYFVWTKGANGYPWDVKTFDQNFVYDRSTELTWTDPRTFKRFNVDLPMSPRCVTKGAASQPIQIPAANSTYSFYSACTAYKTAALKNVLNQVSAPAQVKAGGNIGKVKTRLFTYQYGCDSSYGSCSDKEVFSLGLGIGLYDWNHYVNQNGQWVFAQESKINNKDVGHTTPYFPCPNSYQ